ncbi:MAG: ShlB/FhaC/HecB family hemolysin secretion/activation protein [Candidatus Omnitrophota bacterium]|nr:ShlB/FhaC/HecB family hemolysin secretion/activation protein [Candidatus Omnitrophota bacterium]
MFKKYFNSVFVPILVLGLSASVSFSETPPSTETGSGTLQQQKAIESENTLETKIQKQRSKDKEVIAQEAISGGEGEKVLIRKIIVENVTLIPQNEIQKITSSFEGQELSLTAMQKIADLITAEYRKRGYATSRAYIPPQTLKDATLILRVIEGRLGTYEIRGNRFFKTALLRKRLDLRPGGYFDYTALQRSLIYLNEHPDRKAKAVLVPGKEPGTTDIVIDVQDRLPVHIAFEYDNFGSRYIGKQSGAIVLEHNNLLGFDDKAYFKMQQSSEAYLRLRQGRYTFPINKTTDLGLYVLRSNLLLGKEFRILLSRGKTLVVGTFLNKILYSSDILDVRLNLGFDYKSIKNSLIGIQISDDELRILKTGLDFDFNDRWARNILTFEVDSGISNIFAGMDAKNDPEASRSGAGGRFTKFMANYYRLQPLPLDTNLLFKNSLQFTNNILVAAEQFQIGGPATVRGYAPAEFSGDQGLYSSVEWSLPLYLIPRKVKVPFTKSALYDSFRIVTFFDWATTRLNRTLAGEKKYRTLRGTGVGVRINPNEHFSVRVEIGYPLSAYRPTDKNTAHPWVEITVKF